MVTELKMPALSPTMEKATLARWLVAEGDRVKPGDMIAEIETDKATMEWEAADAGRIARLLIAAGTENVLVGTVVALIGEGEVAEVVAAGAEVVPVAPVAPAPTGPEQAKATPLARRLARVAGIDLNSITGTGARGRIVRADLGLAPPPPPSPVDVSPILSPVTVPPEGVPVEAIKLSAMRKTIARRLSEAKQTVPHFYLMVRCTMDAVLALRNELNASLAGQGIKLSVNDLLMKAMALALVRVPEANVQYGGDVLYRFGRVDIAMAVALEDGLITPVIRDVAAMSLSAIAGASKALAAKARDGRLAIEDYQGGTASLSNLGMYGMDEIIPVINPPHALILGIAAGVKQPWAVNGTIALATIMAATASFDHRAINGAVGAQFMAAFRDAVEQPLQLVC